jgi:ribosomal protein S18 acetylase RimI-like enzyme
MVQLVPMGEDDFRAYSARAVPRYAEDNIKAGAWDPATALEKAERTYRKLLPDGVESENQHLHSIVDEEQDSKIGMIWFMVQRAGGVPSAYICDFEIFEQFRRRGYARRALLALEDRLRAEGVSRIELHVFAHNQAARSLYEKLGYESTGINMAKRLAEES